MRQVVSGEWDWLEQRLRTALELTRELTLLPPQATYTDLPYGVDPELRARVSAQFSAVEILELTFSISVWNALTRFHRVMGFELDMPLPPEGVDTVLIFDFKARNRPDSSHGRDPISSVRDLWRLGWETRRNNLV